MQDKIKEKETYREMLVELKDKLQLSLESAPKGRLRISMKNDRPEFYFCEEGPGTAGKAGRYLRKEFESLIRGLAQKEYDTKLLREVVFQLNKVEKSITGISEEKLLDIYEALSDTRKGLVIPGIKPRAEEIKDWLETPYEPKGFEENAPEIYTEAGERVRSKSEKLIADKLRLMGIPYKYECPMKLAGYGTVYPDFTLLNKNNLKIAMLEHFGMMDDPEYSALAIAKVRSYEKNGFYVGKNLYLTFETTHSPFDARSLEQMLEDFV